MTKEEENNQAQWHYSTAVQFKEALFILNGKFSVITKRFELSIEQPLYFCAGMAVECFLKCYLARNSIAYKKKDSGVDHHNLEGLMTLGGNKLIDFLGLTKADIESISLLNRRYYSDESYGKYDLRYPEVSGIRYSPHPDGLYELLKRIEGKLSSRLKS